MQEEKKYIGYGYHGGGRPKTKNPKSITLSISGTQNEIDTIREMAKKENKTVSRMIIEKIIRSKTMTRNEIDELIQKQVKAMKINGDYQKNFRIYISETGWEDWMNQYTSSEDGEEATESEISEITEIQAENFIECFPNVKLVYHKDSKQISEI